MRVSEIAKRYARAVFSLAQEQSLQKAVYHDLDSLKSILFDQDLAVRDFIVSPLIQDSDKEKVLANVLKDKGLTEIVYFLVLLLAKKGRLDILPDIFVAIQAESDRVRGRLRGIVESAQQLSEQEQQNVAKKIDHVTGKRVMLSFELKPELIGGLLAKVGSLTFDDTLESHLRRMEDELNRRAH